MNVFPRLILLGLSLAVIVLGFQNCGESEFQQNEKSTIGTTVTGTAVNVTERPYNGKELVVSLVEEAREAVTVCEEDSCSYGVSIVSEDRLVQVTGSCPNGAEKAVLSGDILDLATNEVDCVDGKFSLCLQAEKSYEENTVNVVRGSEEGDFKVDLRAAPLSKFSITSLIIKGLKATVKGECDPTGMLDFIIYGAQQNKKGVLCGADGTYSYVVNLVNTTNRVLHVRQSTSSSSSDRTISYDVDAKDFVPSCSLDLFAANEKICKKSAGGVAGTCSNGLPVKIMVNGKVLDSVMCEDGEFAYENILVSKGQENEIKIEQTTPFGKSCSGVHEMDLSSL